MLVIAVQYNITAGLHNGASITRPNFILQANVWIPPKNKTPSYDASLGCCYSCHCFMAPGQDSARYTYPRSPCTANRQHCNTELTCGINNRRRWTKLSSWSIFPITTEKTSTVQWWELDPQTAFFSTALLKYNSQIIQFTHLNCTIQHFSV